MTQSQNKWQWKRGVEWKDYQAQFSQVICLFPYHMAHITYFSLLMKYTAI